MKSVALSEVIVVALLGTLGFMLVGQVLGALLPFYAAFRLAVVTLAFGYISYLLLRRASRVGTAVLGSISLLMLTLAVFVDVSPLGLLVLSAGLVWAVRCLTTYGRLIPCALDLALVLASLGLAGWVFAATGSLVLTTWVWFLCQAGHVVVARSSRDHARWRATSREDRFERAYRAACEALCRL